MFVLNSFLFQLGVIMKSIIILFAIILLSSCAQPYYFYQLQKTKSNNVKFIDSNYVFENNDVKISYNLWGNNGDPGFYFYNKTDKIIYLNLDKSFFILDGIAYDYYQNREWSSSQSASQGVSESQSINNKKSIANFFIDAAASNSKSVSSSSSIISASSNQSGITRIEKKIIKMPPQSAKVIVEFTIANRIYKDCNLVENPDEDEINTLSFNKEKSPHLFSNRLSYSFNPELTDAKTIVNEFWVSEVTNYPEDLFIEYRDKVICNKKSYYEYPYYKYYSSDSYYIEYHYNYRSGSNSFSQ